jgi:exopolysaccharide biosynthesis polyprenyl glycosylphosphotransferase
MLLELYRPLDLVIACGGLLWVVTSLELAQVPSSFPELLRWQFPLTKLLLMMAFLGAWHTSFAAVELYDPRRVRRWRDEAQRLVAGTLPGTVALLGYLASHPGPRIEDSRLFGAAAAFWLIAFFGTSGTRSVLRLVLPAKAGPRRPRVLILGNGPRGQRVQRTLAADPSGHEVLGFVDSRRNGVPLDVSRRTLGTLDELERLLMRNVVDEVIIALPVKSKYAQIQHAISTCERMGVDARYLADVFEWGRSPARHDDTTPLESVALRAVPVDYRQLVKRSVEVAVALGALVALAPVMLVIAAAIRLQDGGPVFFVQQRHGLHKRVFRMVKFRTMLPGAETMQGALEARNEARGAVFKIRDDPRVTRVGAFLRRTSLDELPQLFNVLAGDMSMVGPRPLPPRDVDRFDQSWPMRRFSVRPGITGLWQVSGRSDLSFDELVALDLRYIDEWSLRMDVMIVFRTIGAVLRRRGAV